MFKFTQQISRHFSTEINNLKDFLKNQRKQELQQYQPVILGLVLGITITGFIYIAIFLPLTLRYATLNNLNIVETLTMVHIVKDSIGLNPLEKISLVFNITKPMYLFASGVLYGLLGILCMFLFLQLRKKKVIEVIIIANGLLIGYAVTIWINNLFSDTPVYLVSELSLAYIFILYYGLRILSDILTTTGIKAKYDDLFNGLNSLGAAWILSQIFGTQAVIFTGITFFVCVFITTSAIELIFKITKIDKIFNIFINLEKFHLCCRTKSIIQTSYEMFRRGDKEFIVNLLFSSVVSFIFPILIFGIVNILSLFLINN